MAICTVAEYRGRPEGVEKVKRAIQDFVPYVKAKEPGTRMYLAWQQQDDPTRFVHFFIFEDEVAHEAHSRSGAVEHFEAAYRPEISRWRSSVHRLYPDRYKPVVRALQRQE